jgi:hypothetical protein
MYIAGATGWTKLTSWYFYALRKRRVIVNCRLCANLVHFLLSSMQARNTTEPSRRVMFKNMETPESTTSQCGLLPPTAFLLSLNLFALSASLLLFFHARFKPP